MKAKIFLLASLAIIIMSSCKGYKNNSVKEIVQKENAGQKRQNAANVADLSFFRWKMTPDDYVKARDRFDKSLRDANGSIMFCGMRVKQGYADAKYNAQQLLQMNICFDDYRAVLDGDASKDEYAALEQNFRLHNTKIAILIEALSKRFGNPVTNDFDVNSVNMYENSRNSDKVLAEWNNAYTNAILSYQTELPSGKKGCIVKMRLQMSETSAHSAGKIIFVHII
jgi:hypothetical protein